MDSRGRAFGELFFPSHKWLGEKHVESRAGMALPKMACHFRQSHRRSGPPRIWTFAKNIYIHVEETLVFSYSGCFLRFDLSFLDERSGLPLFSAIRVFFFEPRSGKTRESQGTRKRKNSLPFCPAETVRFPRDRRAKNFFFPLSPKIPWNFRGTQGLP